jgi:hypothetical protein
LLLLLLLLLLLHPLTQSGYRRSDQERCRNGAVSNSSSLVLIPTMPTVCLQARSLVDTEGTSGLGSAIHGKAFDTCWSQKHVLAKTLLSLVSDIPFEA